MKGLKMKCLLRVTQMDGVKNEEVRREDLE